MSSRPGHFSTLAEQDSAWPRNYAAKVEQEAENLPNRHAPPENEAEQAVLEAEKESSKVETKSRNTVKHRKKVENALPRVTLCWRAASAHQGKVALWLLTSTPRSGGPTSISASTARKPGEGENCSGRVALCLGQEA